MRKPLMPNAAEKIPNPMSAVLANSRMIRFVISLAMLEALHIHLRLSESSGRIIFERQLDSLRLKFDYSTTNDRRIVRSSLIRNRKTPNNNEERTILLSFVVE